MLVIMRVRIGNRIQHERAFRVKVKDSRILEKSKRKLEKRVARRNWSEQERPMLGRETIAYEMADRVRAIDCGAIGAFQALAEQTGLVDAIDDALHLLKVHLPYSESDHVLNIALNILAGGTCLEDIELRRNDPAFLDALGAEIIPDPTTAGDFARRFSERDVEALQEAIMKVRVRAWDRWLPKTERGLGIIDVDGAFVPTTGECKEGMDISYKGEWGCLPLLLTLANTRELLYLLNRPGNRPSHEDAEKWLDRAAAWVKKVFAQVCVRGDTDFAMTKHFDRWTAEEILFAFGMDARPNLVKYAKTLSADAWTVLQRTEKRVPRGRRRARPENVKDQIVLDREFENIVLEEERVAEFSYRPGRCTQAYRVIVVHKILTVQKGQGCFWPDERYFFYVTNIPDRSPAEIVAFCNERCEQENVIEQLKNGVKALRMPVDNLVSNWAYMVMASLAWTLKAWFALLQREAKRRDQLLRMEFKGFLNRLVRVPAQIVRTGRRIVYRILTYNEWLPTLLESFDAIKRLRFT